MIEFIKSIFETPYVLWTVPQELCFTIIILVAIGIVTGIYFAIRLLIEKIKKDKKQRK